MIIIIKIYPVISLNALSGSSKARPVGQDAFSLEDAQLSGLGGKADDLLRLALCRTTVARRVISIVTGLIRITVDRTIAAELGDIEVEFPEIFAPEPRPSTTNTRYSPALTFSTN